MELALDLPSRLIPSKDGSLNSLHAESGEHYANMGEGAFSEKLAKHIAPAWEFLQSYCELGIVGSKIPESNGDSASSPTPPESNSLESKLPKSPKPSQATSQSTLVKPKSVRVLDLCLGLGYTALLSRALIATRDPKSLNPHHIHITSIEQDRDVLKLVGAIHGLDSAVLARLAVGERVQIKGLDQATSDMQSGISLRILWGEAHEQLELLLQQTHKNPNPTPARKTPESNALSTPSKQGDSSRESGDKEHAFDIIYQDPFSYEKCPTLWDRTHFSMLHALSKPHCLITSYATRREILLAAHEAGFLTYRYKAPKQTISELLSALGESPDREIVYKRSSSVFSKQPLGFGELRCLFD